MNIETRLRKLEEITSVDKKEKVFIAVCGETDDEIKEKIAIEVKKKEEEYGEDIIIYPVVWKIDSDKGSHPYLPLNDKHC